MVAGENPGRQAEHMLSPYRKAPGEKAILQPPRWEVSALTAAPLWHFLDLILNDY